MFFSSLTKISKETPNTCREVSEPDYILKTKKTIKEAYMERRALSDFRATSSVGRGRGSLAVSLEHRNLVSKASGLSWEGGTTPGWRDQKSRTSGPVTGSV